MAYELGVGLGSYMHISNSLHVYEKHWGMLDAMCTARNTIKSEVRHTEIGAQPQLRSSPPIDELMRFESTLRNVDSIQELRRIVTQVDFGEYWTDWSLMLASHRAKVLGDTSTADEIAASTFFGGLE